jgi:hypothetical protein
MQQYFINFVGRVVRQCAWNLNVSLDEVLHFTFNLAFFLQQ